MRKMSKFASFLDKYGNVDEDKERHRGKIDWYGNMKINGTFSGSEFVAGSNNSFIAKDLIKDSNPRGSILQEAKNYTDSKAKNLYYHFITLTGSSGSGSSGSVYVTYISEYASEYTIATLKNALSGKSLVCGGYLDGVAEFISSGGRNLVVGVIDVTDGSTTGETIDNTFTIKDEVTPI